MIFADLAALETLAKHNDLEAIKALIPSVEASAHAPVTAPRSALMVSAHRLKHLNKLDNLAADALMINLEDGVDVTQKPLARHLATLFVASAPEAVRGRCVVRINPLGEGGEEDLALVVRARPGAVRLPKVTSADQVRYVLEHLPAGTMLHLSVETREAYADIAALVVDHRVTTLYLGILDLMVSLGLPHSLLVRGNPTIDYLLARFLVETKTAGAHPVSFVYQNHLDDEGFRAWCLYEKAMGFEGKGVISPRQVTIANELFAPDPEKIMRAREIVRLFEESRAGGESGFAHLDYGFIDEPIYKDAVGLLEHLKV